MNHDEIGNLKIEQLFVYLTIEKMYTNATGTF